MLSWIDKNIIITYWVDRLIWLSSSAVILISVCTMSIAQFGFFSGTAWTLMLMTLLLQVVALTFQVRHHLIGVTAMFLATMMVINFLGLNTPVESGLAYVYPLMAATAIMTIKRRKELYTIITLGFISFVVYMSVSIPLPAGHLTTFNPIVNFSVSFLCICVSLFNVLVFSRKWQERERNVSDRYDRLSNFVKFVNESPLALMRIDAAGEILLMNNSAKQLVSQNSEEAVKFPPGFSQIVMESLASGQTRELETRYGGRDLHFTMTPNTDLQYVNIYGEDMSELQGAITELHKLNRAINLAADGIAIFDQSGRLEYINESLCDILGYTSAKELKEINWMNLCEDSWYSRYKTNIAPKLQLEHVWRGEAESIRADGSVLDTYLTLTRIPEGRTICYLRDNTNVKAYQDELILARNNAESATRAKSDFLATMSHEIRTPMNGVLGMASLMAGTQLDNTQKEYIETILQSGENLMSIINEILDFSKIEAGKMELDLQKVSTKKIIHNAMNLASHKASQKGNTLTATIGPNVPMFILADRGRISQVVNNLLNNACKFTTNGKIHIQMDADPTENDREYNITLAVTDTGLGISPQKTKSLFEPFVQADSSTTRKYGGTGLGLAISKKLAELMDGTILVKSKLKEGSEFTLKFTTLGIPGTQEEEELISHYTVDSSLSQKFPLNILVAEDNVINQKLAHYIFAQMGYNITIVNNGVEAVDLAQSVRFDIIFMDLHMPEKDGIQATQEILDTVENPPTIVALTANVIAESRQMCEAAGMSGFIHKPFKTTEIERLIRSMFKETVKS